MAQPSGPESHLLGAYIRAQRQMAALSLRQLAEMTDVSNAYLSQIERGLHQPSIRVLRSIATALGISAERLLAEAGLVEGSDPPRARAGENAVEDAIAADPDLGQQERDVLLGLYRTLRRRSS
jgi:transcriptional regulator with XRE-family HTH domain